MSTTATAPLSFIPGQRWISDAEIDLGLGTILQSDRRSITLLFPGKGETRVYSTSTAPLTRVIFSEGDTLTHQDGWQMKVEDTKEVDGLLVYLGEDSQGEFLEVPETQLDPEIRFQGPRERLLTGQIDRNNEFHLRALARQAQTQLAKDSLRGLRGPRVGLVPHQLYIAHEVGQRLAPRVLLADEVGLGKTIEAGMILHQQLVTGRAQRALILVPESLCHQWLVELLRRFGLPVTLMNAERCQDQETPFADAQIALASLDWLVKDDQAYTQVQEESWDLLIVDEAHHLGWSPAAASPEYLRIQQLAEQIPGLLLLTATPEQSGESGFFGQLQLLDPARYPSLEAFQQEEGGYRLCAQAINRLELKQPLDAEELKALEARLSNDSQKLLTLLEHPETSDEQRDQARQQLIDQLLDRYGTGRVLFRNRRASVPGFPGREVHPVGLDCPEAYLDLLEQFNQPHRQMMAEAMTGIAWPFAALYPERLYASGNQSAGDWWQFDPRVDWLLDKLEELKEEKVLLICAHAETALELSEALRRRSGLLAAVFHEDMDLFDRDRAAAWFAEEAEEGGAPLLICSEIGSEGRNFQFAHHLVLFDLPSHPDLLEQRIGRLDRIGQNQTIQLHVPYLETTAQADWLSFCHEGLEQFTRPCAVGASLYQEYQDDLLALLSGEKATDDLIPLIQSSRDAAEIELEAGRHRLLELASHRPEVSGQLVAQLAEADQDKLLREFLEVALDVYRIQNEDLDEHTWYLKPGKESDTAVFTDVHFDMEEGSSATFLRDKAMARDDLHFLTWEHPLTRNCLEAATTTVKGNTAVALLKNPALPAGTLLLEVFFRLDLPGLHQPLAERYLPSLSLRLLLDGQGNNLAPKVGFKGLSKQLVKMKKGLARDVVKLRVDQLRGLMDKAESEAASHLPSYIEEAQERMRQQLDPEIARLQALAEHNPAVKAEEISQLQQVRLELDTQLNQATLKMDALRVIVAAGRDDG
ncbi:ATP-dependent helicase HepA [Marinospirillum celere]|uniref:RNA polymerase-associated protein RapA n=1 Tax=Marinospirillum celere TaxID=1122252 RepID=A0A1I1HY29_9GAMM|nr:RNA polymerase-associated protein RapA [Marinospirillum celere]SFC28997.1 ATP-dependent helicase HepA [Marinospirillum celere]